MVDNDALADAIAEDTRQRDPAQVSGARPPVGMMRIGITPSASTRSAALQLAEAAVAGGLDTLWLGDGYLDNPDFPMWAGGLENLTHLAWLAGRYPTARIGSSAAVLPLRDPAWLAKQAATIDQLTEGRFILVVAPGFWAKESEHRGLDFETRGTLFAEHLDALVAGLRGDGFDGPTVHLPAWGRLSPVPYTPGGPPIWLAGGPATMRRAIDRGLPYQASRLTPDELEPIARRFDAEGGTDLCLRVRVQVGDAPAEGQGVQWHAVTGSPDALVDALGRYRELGVRDLSLIPGQDDAVSLRTIEVLVAEVLPQLGLPER